MTLQHVQILEQMAAVCDTSARLAKAMGKPTAALLEADRNAIEAALVLWTRLNDEAFAEEVAVDCGNPNHDVRYCSMCEERKDGIENYRDRMLKGA